MGKHIDRAALGAVLATGYYLFFLNAWGSIPLACICAFVGCALTGIAARGLPKRDRASRARVRAELHRLAGLGEQEAGEALSSLVRERWPLEDCRLVPALKHPEASLSSGDVLNAWRANRDAGRLVIAATCPCEPRAAAYARQLRGPAVAVVDSRSLARILRAKGEAALPPLPRVSLRERLRYAAGRVLALRPSPRNALLAAALLATYLATGNPYSLFAALALLCHLGVALLHGRPGRRLFEA